MSDSSRTAAGADVFAAIAVVLEQRRQADPAGSYTAGLFAKGREAILQKVGEEAVETILACTSADRKQIIHETADLWFHTLVMLAHERIDHTEVFAELTRRFGTSGVEEKRSRGRD